MYATDHDGKQYSNHLGTEIRGLRGNGNVSSSPVGQPPGAIMQAYGGDLSLPTSDVAFNLGSHAVIPGSGFIGDHDRAADWNPGLPGAGPRDRPSTSPLFNR